MSGVNWIIKGKDIPETEIYSLMKELKIGYLLASVLCARGINNAKEAKAIISHEDIWHNPMLLPDIALAINRIKNAKANIEKSIKE